MRTLMSAGPPPASQPRRKAGKSKRGRTAATPEKIREEVAEVKEIVLGLERFEKSTQLYPAGSAILKQQLEEVYERLSRFLHRVQALELAVVGDEVEYEGETVYDATKSSDRSNIAYTLEDGGVRRIVFLSGIDRAEIQGFVDALRESRNEDADDLVTLLWTHGLRHVSYMTVNFYAETNEPSIEELLQQSTRATIVDRLRNRELSLDQIAMVRTDHTSEAADQDLPEIFALSPQENAEIQRRIAEYQGDSGLGPFCRVIMSLLMHDSSEETCRSHLGTLQEALSSLIDEGEIAIAADVVQGVRRLADATGGGYGSNRGQVVALRGFIAVAAKKEHGARMAEHLARGRIDMKPVLAYIRALGKHAIYIASELLGGRSDAKVVGAIAEGCAGDYIHIRDFVADPNARLAAAAVRILSEVAGDGARVDFIKASMHKDPTVRREAFVALAKCKDPRALDRLLAAFDDADPEIRESSLRAFGSCLWKPRQELFPRVLALAEDKKFAERPAAEQAALYAILGKLDPEKGVPYLRTKLTGWALFNRSYANHLRLMAAAALAEVATDDAEAALRTAGEKANETMRAACRSALDRLELVRASAKQQLDREKAGFDPDRSSAVKAFDRSAGASTRLPALDGSSVLKAKNAGSRKAPGG
ncbi:MAG TPA: HEAT repeat domain-containing protein [Planctomycetota bacterium]|nr:HEAT repeat domain-containing protein [Planctomycetota bacterium]